MERSAEDAMAGAAMHLRMVLLGHTSYSASVTAVDRGHANLLLEKLRQYGFDVVPTSLKD